jgi:superoxide dismutase, Cu-Zn family
MTRKLLAAVVLSLPVFAVADVRASARLLDPQGKQIGRADFIELKGGVAVVVTLAGVSPGAHAVAVHAAGRCEGGLFETAGARLAVVPDVEASPAGTLHAAIFGADLTLASPGPLSLVRPGGTSLLVYDAPGVKGDAAASPGRPIACGVISVRNDDRVAAAPR